jgi:hypothetical protein
MKNLPFAALALCLALIAAPARSADHSAIREADVLAAQQAWVAGLVGIGAAGDAAAAAGAVLDELYDFDGAGVLFKPTLAGGATTFRTTRAGALAYFVGGDPEFDRDSGFALKPYVAGAVSLAGVLVQGELAIAMGKITLQAADGSEVTVDKTFAYRRDADGRLRIIAHHSSLPWAG